MDLRIAGLPEGRYGLSAYVDADGDGKLGKDWLGRPTEALGFSNDAPIGRFGPPGFEAAGMSALAKLQQVLPAGLAGRVRDVDEATVRLPGPALDPFATDVLLVLAQACRHRTAVRIGYTTAHGTAIDREVEPLRIVHAGRRWYLVGLDVEHHGAVAAGSDVEDVDALDTEELIGPGAPRHAGTTHTVGHVRVFSCQLLGRC